MQNLKKHVLLSCFVFIFCLVTIAQNQNKLFNDFGNGTYTTYKAESKSTLSGGYALKLEKLAKQWPVLIQPSSSKDFDGNLILESVIISRQGVLKENFTPDIPENPVYFGFKDQRVSIIGDKIYYYEWLNDNAKIIYLLSKNSVDDYDNEKQKLENHIRGAFKNQQAARGKLNEIREANSLKEAAENSLKGKSVKSIELVVVDLPTQLGLRSTIKFGVKAITADGKVYSTPNIGGKTTWDDFIIKTNEGNYVEDAVEIFDDAAKVPNDEVKITVASKYSSTLTTQKIFPLNYATDKFIIKQNGRHGYEWLRDVGGVQMPYRGENGKTLDIKIQQGLTKTTNIPIYKIEVIDIQSGKIINRIKVSAKTILTIDVRGGDGDKGSNRKSQSLGKYVKADDGKDGGNGGNITIHQSADSKDLNLIIVNNGGKAGSGGEGISNLYNGMAGRDGKDGTVTTKVLVNKMNW